MLDAAQSLWRGRCLELSGLIVLQFMSLCCAMGDLCSAFLACHSLRAPTRPLRNGRAVHHVANNLV